MLGNSGLNFPQEQIKLFLLSSIYVRLGICCGSLYTLYLFQLFVCLIGYLCRLKSMYKAYKIFFF